MFNFCYFFLQIFRFDIIIVIFKTVFRVLMTTDLSQNIENLKKDILRLEDNIEEFSRLRYNEGIKRSVFQIQSNLKYLSVLANGAPIDKNEDRKIMNFLQVHYDYLKKISIWAS